MSSVVGAKSSVAVEIFNSVFYTEKIMISCEGDLREQGTVNSQQVYTGFYPKAKRITLKGRIYCFDAGGFIVAAEGLMQSQGEFEVTYRDLFFRNCRCRGVNITDTDGDFYCVEVLLNCREGVEIA